MDIGDGLRDKERKDRTACYFKEWNTSVCQSMDKKDCNLSQVDEMTGKQRISQIPQALPNVYNISAIYIDPLVRLYCLRQTSAFRIQMTHAINMRIMLIRSNTLMP